MTQKLEPKIVNLKSTKIGHVDRAVFIRLIPTRTKVRGLIQDEFTDEKESPVKERIRLRLHSQILQWEVEEWGRIGAPCRFRC